MFKTFRSPACACLLSTLAFGALGLSAQTPFRIFMIASKASDHIATSTAAKAALEKMGTENGFTVDYTLDTSLISEANLDKYQVFFQEHLAPFEVSNERRAAVEKFVASGRGWIGVHAAGLTHPEWFHAGNWDWYESFFGSIRYVTHPALQTGTAIFEDRTHPATKNMPATAQFKDEWYEWDGNPRARVRVLAKADEKTYTQVKPQGDHPIIWSNETYPKMIYLGIGHDVSVWSHPTYLLLVRDAIMWAKPATTKLDPQAAAKGYLGSPRAARVWASQGKITMGWDGNASTLGGDASTAGARTAEGLWDPLGHSLPVLKAEGFKVTTNR